MKFLPKFSILALSLLIGLSGLLPARQGLAEPVNLIPNPSVETPAIDNTQPSNWFKSKWGTNSATFSYINNDANTGNRSLQVNMTQRSSGDAKWYFNHTAVKPAQKYTFSNYYKSNVATEVVIEYISNTNKYSYKWLNTSAASTAWKQNKLSFTTPANAKTLTVYHLINKAGWLQTDDFSLIEGDGTTPPPAPTPPTVQISTPENASTVSGTQTVTANATDAQGIKQVQFKLDDGNLGQPDTTAPYSVNWDTKTSLDGDHTLSAVATNNANLTATASSVNVRVDNQLPPPPPPTTANLIANPSLETDNGGSPAAWQAVNWGSNNASFSYLNSGHSGSRSVKAEITSYINGAANWYYPNLSIGAGKTYKYENWYQSNVDTEVDAEVRMNDGSTQYFWLASVPASTMWNKATAVFVAPAGAQSVTIYHLLGKAGYLITDDYSLSEYTPRALNRPLVSVTLDDGWASQYQNGLPILNQYGLKATFYVFTNALTDQPNYMSTAQVQSLYGQGMEIGSHSLSHSDLTQVSQNQLVNELMGSQNILQNAIGAPVVNFAYPYGAFNANTKNTAKQYYQSQRSVIQGYNTIDSFDATQLKIYEIYSNTSPVQVQGWIDGAIQQKTWLILLYHEVGANIGESVYNVSTTNFNANMSYLKNSGVTVVTMQQALNEINAQL